MRARKLSANNDYSLAAIERDLLEPLSLKLSRDKSGAYSDLTSDIAGVEGSLEVVANEPESYTPQLLLNALDGAERAEREFMKTGVRKLSAGENPRADNIDFERATILANLLTGNSLEMLAARGLHGSSAGNREQKIKAVIDYLYKGSYGRDLYTDTPIIGRSTDQGHLESNSRGGVRLRPELSLINQMLGDSEGLERLKRIDQARTRIRGAGSFNDKVLNDPDIQRLTKYKDFNNFLGKIPKKAETYGFTEPAMAAGATSNLNRVIQIIDRLQGIGVDASPMSKHRMAGSPAIQGLLQEVAAGRDAQAAGPVVGEKPLVVNAGEGSKVYLRTNGNGHNGNGTVKHMFSNGK